MDLGLKNPTKLSIEEHGLLRQTNIDGLFFMGIRTNVNEKPTLVLHVRSPEGELNHKAGSKAAQNSAYREGIDDTMTYIYNSSNHFLSRAANLHSGSFTDLQGSHINKLQYHIAYP